jgi:isopenicillin N synthase-like dioxygenase
VFKSTVHRVVTGGERERHSCAFFWEPNFDTAVAPLPQCVSDQVGLHNLNAANHIA